MTTQGVIVIVLVGLIYLIWISRLIIKKRLHPVYGTVWIFWIVIGVLIIAIPPLLNFVTALVGAVFPASALSLLAFMLLFGMQIYLLSQLSIISRRVTAIAEYLAIEKATLNQEE